MMKMILQIHSDNSEKLIDHLINASNQHFDKVNVLIKNQFS